MRWSIIILMSLSLACSKKEPAAPAESEQAADTETPAAATPAKPVVELAKELEGETPAAGAPPVLNVLERGQEPRQALRWNIKPGFEQKVSVKVGFSIDAIVAVLRVGDAEYVVSCELTMRAKKVEDDGTVRVAFAVDQANTRKGTLWDNPRGNRLKLALATTRKVTGSYRLGPRGAISDFKMNVPSDANRSGHDMADNLRLALIQMTPTFPKEPLGQGAQWTVHESVNQGGIRVNQLTTMEIVKTEGTRVELAVNVQQSSAPQPFQNPGTALTLALLSSNGMASGSLGWDLTELAPHAANIEASVTKIIRQDPKDPTDPKQKPVEMIVKADRSARITEK